MLTSIGYPCILAPVTPRQAPTPPEWGVGGTGARHEPSPYILRRDGYREAPRRISAAARDFDNPAGHRASFQFSGSGGNGTLSFECKLRRPHVRGKHRRRARFASCSSPRTFGKLAPGRYRFRVRAVDATGQRDLTPAKRKFRIRPYLKSGLFTDTDRGVITEVFVQGKGEGGRCKTAKRRYGMPPNSTQNLNAKLSLTPSTQQRPGGSGISLTPSPIQGYAPPNQIVGAPAQYRGGYHLSF